MKLPRRKFLRLAAGGVALPAVSRIARAQPEFSPKRLTVVTSFKDAAEGRPYAEAIEKSFQKAGWTPKANLAISYIWAGSDPVGIVAAVEKLPDTNADVILAAGTGVLTAVNNVVRSTPIVFVQVSDPVGGGFVQSLEKPGGSITGVRNPDLSIFGERVAITKELAPLMKRVLVLSEPGYPTIQRAVLEIQTVAATLDVSVISKSVADAHGMEQAIREFANGEGAALAIITSPKMTALRQVITQLAASFRMPAVYPLRSYVEAGGLASYGITLIGMYEQGSEIIDLVLKGKRPDEIPVQSPTKTEFLIKRKAVADLGLQIPVSLVTKGATLVD